ncbi:MAG: MCE family protein, partial [Sphingomonas sp.]
MAAGGCDRRKGRLMETKANYVLVGVFTVVILLLSFGFVYWSANVSDKDQQVSMIVRIEGSVTGLSVGSQVLFNGLRVGDVRSLRIDPNDPRVVIAMTRLEATTPVTTSTRATIGFAGLTGQAFIELKGGDASERNIIAYAQEQGAIPVIKADPSDVTDILATAKDIAERANNILTQFEAVAGDIQPAVRTTADNITATSQNVRVFTDSLAANSDQINGFIGSISRLAGTANTVAEALPDAIRSAQAVVEAVDPASVRTTVDNVAAISGTLRAQSDKVASVVDSIETAAASVGSVGEAIQRNTPAIDRFLTNLGPISDTATSV